jgi:hypothetical protein
VDVNKKIKAIQILDDDSVYFIRDFGGHGMRSDKMVLFADNVDSIQKSMLCMSCVAKDEYIAINMCDKRNRKLIKTIVEHYESKR